MSAPRWQTSEPGDWFIREWDAGGVLYDPASGDTHRLSALHFELLELLREPSSLHDLLASLAEALPPELDGDGQADLIEEELQALQLRGLIRNIAS